MTSLIFIRHCESDHSVKDEWTRPLTEKGWADRERITATLEGVPIDGIYASPYLRTLDTVSHLAETRKLRRNVRDGLRERWRDKTCDMTPEVFSGFIEKQWADMDYTVPGWESLRSVQKRNITVLEELLIREKDRTAGIATHGCALSTILNYYDPTLTLDNYWYIVPLLPYIIRLDFEGDRFISMREIPLIG